MKLIRFLPFLSMALTLTAASCARNHAVTRRADPQEAPYSTTRSRVTPENTGNNTAGHQNRVNRAEADR